MVLSGKKKRAKERKDAKKRNKEMNDALVDAHNDIEKGGSAYITCPHLIERLAKTQLEKVQKGRDEATVALYDSDRLGFSAPHVLSIRSVPIVLNFLKRCEDESFEQVIDSVGGDLKTPMHWIEVLAFSVRRLDFDCNLQIAENISPLVGCMCNDTERLFFKSNEHWGESIILFTALIYHLLTKQDNVEHVEYTKIAHSLLNHGGLLRSIVQWGFWDEHRPDIAKEIKAEDLAHIASAGVQITQHLLRGAINNEIEHSFSLTISGKSLIEIIATTPIINNEYDSSCMISCVAGLIRLMKAYVWGKDDLITLLVLYLTGDRDFVDSAVITELIDLGLNYSEDCACDTAERLGNLLKGILLKKEQMNDNKIQISESPVRIQCTHEL